MRLAFFFFVCGEKMFEFLNRYSYLMFNSNSSKIRK